MTLPRFAYLVNAVLAYVLLHGLLHLLQLFHALLEVLDFGVPPLLSRLFLPDLLLCALPLLVVLLQVQSSAEAVVFT